MADTHTPLTDLTTILTIGLQAARGDEHDRHGLRRVPRRQQHWGPRLRHWGLHRDPLPHHHHNPSLLLLCAEPPDVGHLREDTAPAAATPARFGASCHRGGGPRRGHHQGLPEAALFRGEAREDGLHLKLLLSLPGGLQGHRHAPGVA